MLPAMLATASRTVLAFEAGIWNFSSISCMPRIVGLPRALQLETLRYPCLNRDEPTRDIVSFLNDLKKQADQLRAGQGVDLAAQQSRIQATEQVCQMTFKYWVDLCSQLDVLQPLARGRYVFDSKAAFDG